MHVLCEVLCEALCAALCEALFEALPPLLDVHRDRCHQDLTGTA